MQEGYFLLLFAFVLVAFLTGFLLAVFTFAATLELPPPILNIFVPHVVQIPLMACRPFFIVICLSSFMSRLDLHFTQ